MAILVTGGAGYIGSHTVLSLLSVGHEVVVLDNLYNSSQESLRRVERLAGRTLTFVEGDIRDSALLGHIFEQYSIAAVIHFAGLKAVGESVMQPLTYYQNNVAGTLALCQAMQAAEVYRLVFSSSATVYGDGHPMPLHEGLPTGKTTNPYGHSKLMIEEILQDLAASDDRWTIALLRYFNPIGAHHSGLIGEDPNGIPNNLVPYVSQVAVGKLKELSIFGDDYSTKDGTGVRDYIHVVDLAKGHLAALEYLNEHAGAHVWNLGTGKGYSVKEVVQAFSRSCGVDIPCKVVERRPGDIAECWSDPGKALRELGWKAEKGLDEMMEDTWRWQSKNPEGYKGSEF